MARCHPRLNNSVPFLQILSCWYPYPTCLYVMWCLVSDQSDEEAATRIQAAFRGFKERRERIAAGKPVFLRTTRRMGAAHRTQGGVPQHQGRVSTVRRCVDAAVRAGGGGGGGEGWGGDAVDCGEGRVRVVRGR